MKNVLKLVLASGVAFGALSSQDVEAQSFPTPPTLGCEIKKSAPRRVGQTVQARCRDLSAGGSAQFLGQSHQLGTWRLTANLEKADALSASTTIISPSGQDLCPLNRASDGNPSAGSIGTSSCSLSLGQGTLLRLIAGDGTGI